MMNERSEMVAFILLVAVIGLFYLATIQPGHNWGGDFSQYIHHAKNLATGKPYGETGYLFSPSFASIGPSAYPPGYPILLTPVYYQFGLSMRAFKVELIFFLVLTLPLLYVLFKEDLPFDLRIVLVTLFALNPFILALKDFVISDIPFLFFAMLSIYMAEAMFRSDRLGYGPAVPVSVLIFSSYLIRSVGIVLVPALLAYDIYRRRRLSRFTIATAVLMLALVLGNSMLSESGGSYTDRILGWRFGDFLRNMSYYTVKFYLLWSNVFDINYTQRALYFLTLPVVVVGLVTKVRTRLSLYDFFVVTYLGLLLVYPGTQKRFIVPIAPFYFLCLILGARRVAGRFSRRKVQYAFIGILITMVVLSYAFGLREAIISSRSTPDGPYRRDARAAFDYISGNTEQDDIISFRKPRVLSLFTERTATAYPKDGDADAIKKHFEDFGVTHVIVHLDVERDRERLMPAITANAASFQELFRNTKFVIYSFSGEDTEESHRD